MDLSPFACASVRASARAGARARTCMFNIFSTSGEGVKCPLVFSIIQAQKRNTRRLGIPAFSAWSCAALKPASHLRQAATVPHSKLVAASASLTDNPARIADKKARWLCLMRSMPGKFNTMRYFCKRHSHMLVPELAAAPSAYCSIWRLADGLSPPSFPPRAVPRHYAMLQ